MSFYKFKTQSSNAPATEPGGGFVRTWFGLDGILRTINESGVVVVHSSSASISSAIAAHEAAADPHPQYTTTIEAAAAAPVQSVNTQTGAVVLTKASVGLANVDNTSDVNKPVSTAQNTAINAAVTAHTAAGDPHPQYTTVAEASAASPVQSVAGKVGVVTLIKGDVGLGNVDNTSDLNKPVSTAQNTAINAAVTAHTALADPHPQYLTTAEGNAAYAPISHTQAATTVTNAPTGNLVATNVQAALNELQSDVDTRILLSEKGAANGVATLDGTGKVPAAQIPGGLDEILEFANFAAFPVTGVSGNYYLDLATGRMWRWSGSVYVEVSPSPGTTDAVPEGSVNLYFTNPRASAAAPVQSVAGKVGSVTLVKADVGLGNVDNTSDINKPVSTAQNTAINAAITAHVALADPHTQYTTAAEASAAAPVQSVAGKTGAVTLVKGDVGLGNVDNTSDVNKPTSTAQLASINSAVSAHESALNPHPQYLTAAAIEPTVRATPLTGLDVTVDAEITATDTVLSALGKLQAQNNVWIELVLPSDLTNSSNVTLTNVPALSFPVVNACFYRIEVMMKFRSAATGTGIGFTVQGSGGAAGSIALISRVSQAADGTAHEYSGAMTTLGDLVLSTAVPAANTSYCGKIEGTFDCTANGTLTLQFRSETGTTVTLEAGSSILVRCFV
jgi:hypothetical protein